MSNDKQYNYGYDIQLLYLELFLTSLETFVICQTIFDHSLFDKKLQPIAKFINDFVNEHRQIPSLEIVNASTRSELRPLDDVKPEYYDWLLSDFEAFIRHKGLEKAIIESSELLSSGMYGLVEDKIKSAVQKSLNKDLGTNYYYDPRGRLMKIKDNNGQMATGWAKLDRQLYGGLNRGELSIFCAQSGGGKSLFLANLGLNWSQSGMNVLYVTLELAEELVALRVDAMSTGINTKNIFKSIDDVELKVKILGKKSGSFQIKYMPSGKTCNDVRAYIKEYETKMNTKVDILLIDYLDLMHPIGKNISAENLFMKDKYVSEELRNLAIEQRCVTVTAAQFNRCLTLDTKVIKDGVEIFIKDVKVGDKLSSNNGTVDVLEVLPIIKQQVYKIKTKSGKEITCSANHKFPVNGELKTISTGLKVGDMLKSINTIS